MVLKAEIDDGSIAIGYFDGSNRYLHRRRADYLIVSTNHKRRANGGWSGGSSFLQHSDHRYATVGPAISGITSLNRPFWLTPTCAPLTFANTSPVLPASRPPISKEDGFAGLSAWGTVGWNRTRPGNPGVDLAQTLAELAKDGLPTLPLRLALRTKRMNSLGKEYLNAQFGWAPLLSDLRKLYQTWKELDRRLAQIARDNGRGIRRRADLGTSKTVTVVSDLSQRGFAYMFPVPALLPGSFNQGYSRQVVTLEESTHRWYSARYRYWIPDVGTSQWKRRTVRALFGVNPTPALLWELMPWSWLSDYFLNVGSVVSNISANAVDNLVADYAFMMQTTSVVRTTEVWYTGCSEYKSGGLTHSSVPGFSTRYVDSVVTKVRTHATPFGFGLTFDGLSTYQQSILAALGISRSRF